MKKNYKISSSKNILKVIQDLLEKEKAIAINSINLMNRSSIADYMIIASGNSSRHVSSMSKNLVNKLKENHIQIRKPEGLNNSDWVLIDVIDVVVHLFRPEVREFYKLDKMWEIPNSTKSNKHKH